MIATSDDLVAALRKCGGGETITIDRPLTDVSLGGLSFARPVTIVGEFHSSGAAKQAPALTLGSCSGFVLDGCSFVGRVGSDGWRWGAGFRAEACSDIVLNRPKITNAWLGAWVGHSAGVTIAKGDIIDPGSLGIQIAGQNDSIEISDTQVRGFHVQQPEHSDGIMIFTGPDWGPGSEWARHGSTNVKVLRNLVEGDPNDQPQGIFLRDAGGGKALGFPHRNVEIRGNKILCPMWGGIACESFENLAIVDNDVLLVLGRADVPGGQVTEARIMCDAMPDVLSGNTATLFTLGSDATGWTWPVVDGVRRVPAGTMADADRIAAAWLAARDGSPPTPAPSPVPAPVPASADVLDRIRKARLEANNLKNGAARSVYALDQLLKEMGG